MADCRIFMRWRVLPPFCIMPAMPQTRTGVRLELSKQSHLLVVGFVASFFLPSTLLAQPEALLAVTGTAAQQSRTPSPYIGSAMALLATFEDAGVLPPEGTPQANGIIKAVIQFQSAFLKSHNPAVQHFFLEAHRAKFGPRAGEIESSFRLTGWSADSFDAVMAAGQPANTWNADGLDEAFREFNIGILDFELLAQLYEKSTAAFSTQGKTFQEVYAQRRREMPGAKSE